jgi:excisionase family DNA binding protein
MKDLRLSEIEAFAVPAKKAAPSIGVGMTRLYELIKAREIESYRDGKARKVVVASLKAYVERQIAAEAARPRVGWTDRATEARMAKKMLANVSLDVQRGVSKNCQRRRGARNPHHK